MIVHEENQVASSVQCCAVEMFHEGKASMTVQRETISEQYVCFSQGQEKRPAQLVAIQWKHMLEVNNKIAEPRPGYSPGPGLWPYTVGKQPAMKHSRRLDQG